MINKEEFEKNFATNNERKLAESGIDIVRLYAARNGSTYRAVEFLTKPLDEYKVKNGYLKSEELSEKHGVSISVENFGRGEGETILRRSFSVKIENYNRGSDKAVLELIERLKAAEKEFHS